MTMFCRLSFLALRRIYHRAINSMLIFLVVRQVLVRYTIPPHITSTLSRPDLVLVSANSIVLLELSVVTNTQQHFLAAKTRKEDRYGSLLSDLQHAGYVVDLVTIEVGCLGHFMPETVSKLSTVCHLPKRSINQILQRAARVAISCSYRIFNSRTSMLWDVVDLTNG